MAKKKDKTYRAGAYKRLSQDDGRGEVSNSIITRQNSLRTMENHTAKLKSLQSMMTMAIRGRTLTAPVSCG